MKRTLYLLMTLLVLSQFTLQNAVADDGLEGLADLAEDGTLEEISGGDASDLDLGMSDSEENQEEAPALSLNYGGYIKTLAYWNEEQYSDFLWAKYQQLAGFGLPAPDEQKISGYNNIGTRMQFKLEGYLGDRARLFTAFNVNHNLVTSLHEPYNASAEEANTDIRMVESFVELYEGSRTWKIGSQLVTWGYMEGAEVPTDRVNARDQSYKSTEYEDAKLPSFGILMTQTLGDLQLEIMAIPVAKQNVSTKFSDYFYTGTDEEIERKPNNGKWASRFSGTFGNLDAALSYVEGLDAVPDLKDMQMNARAYNRIKSPGLDLQYNFSSFLAKLSYAKYFTEDTEGTDPLIKNDWSKYAAGVEFSAGGSTINIYVGQTVVEEFKTDQISQNTNFLLGQFRERTDFISAHMNSNFLTGDALNLVLMVAGYWDEEGESVQSFAKSTINYKISDGLNLLISPMYTNYMENIFNDLQVEVKYSF